MSTVIEDNCALPGVLTGLSSLIKAHWDTLHRYEIDAFDFEPFDEFLPEDDVIFEIFLGCDYPDQSGIAQQFKMFGCDGAGGQYAIWVRQPGDDLMRSPVVFFDSEGDFAVMADHIGEFIWLCAVAFGEDEKPILLEPLVDFSREWAGEVEAELQANGYQTQILKDRATEKHKGFIAMMEKISEALA